MPKIKIRGINGEYLEIDLSSGKVTNTSPTDGTILNNSGPSPHTPKGRSQLVARQVDHYNNRQHKVRNFADNTNKLSLKLLIVVYDNGEYKPMLADYIPSNEAPTEITGPEKLFVETVAIPVKPVLLGAAELLGRYGSGALKEWGRKTVLEDVFKRVLRSPKEMIPYTGANIIENSLTYDKAFGIRPVVAKPDRMTWRLWDQYPLSKPKLSLRELLGLSKGAVGDLNKFLKDALEDYSLYFYSGKLRNKFVFNPKTNKFEYVSEVLPYHVSGEKEFLAHPDMVTSHYIRSFGGQASYFPKWNRVSLNLVPVDESGKSYAGLAGEMRASVRPESRSTSIVLTSPKVDAQSLSWEDPAVETAVNLLPNKINKHSMRLFWSAVDEFTKPGTYLSGDYEGIPLGGELLIKGDEPFGLSKVYKTLISEPDIRDPKQYSLYRSRTGLSPDSYSSIVRLGLRPGHSLRFSRYSFGKLNDSAVDNADLYQMWRAAKTPELKQQFVETWNRRIYPNSSFIDERGDIQFLHPFVYYKKLGGRLISKGLRGFALPTKDQVINFYNQYKNNWENMDLRLLSGLLGNLWVESQFNPRAVNGKYQGYALLDMNSSKYTRARYGWTDLGQILGILDYANGKIPSKYSGNSGYLMSNYLNYHKNNPNYTPADSADYWRRTFENTSHMARERRDTANAIYGYLNSYLKPISQDTLLNNPLLQYTLDLLAVNPDALYVQRPVLDIQLHKSEGNMLKLVPKYYK